MIKWFLHRFARRFGAQFNYDVGYMHDVINVSASAGMRLAAFPMVAGYRGPAEAGNVIVGAAFASVLDGDCGPCAQLVVDMAVQHGADANALKLCAEGRAADARDVGLGFRFAQAAITDSLETEELRQEINHLYGEKAVVAASFAAATGRFYPVFKRGLGHGEVCQRVKFDAGDVVMEAAA